MKSSPTSISVMVLKSLAVKSTGKDDVRGGNTLFSAEQRYQPQA
jgi:hypothetical protein